MSFSYFEPQQNAGFFEKTVFLKNGGQKVVFTAYFQISLPSKIERKML
jgi:hypothetical protein